MDHKNRAKTIDAAGNIISKPYGAGRWHSPRNYGCAHDGCTNPAVVTARRDAHPEGAHMSGKSHNCCGQH